MKRSSPRPTRNYTNKFIAKHSYNEIVESYADEKNKYKKVIVDLFISAAVLVLIFLSIIAGLYYTNTSMSQKYDLTRFGGVAPAEFQMYSHQLKPGETPEYKWLDLSTKLVQIKEMEPLEKKYLLLQQALVLNVDTKFKPVNDLALSLESYKEPKDIYYYEMSTDVINRFIKKYSPHSYSEMKQYMLINEKSLKPIESIKVSFYELFWYQIDEITSKFRTSLIGPMSVVQILLIAGSAVLAYGVLGYILTMRDIRKETKGMK